MHTIKDTIPVPTNPLICELMQNIPHEYTWAILNEIAGEQIYLEYDMFGADYRVNADNGLCFHLVRVPHRHNISSSDTKYPYYYVFRDKMVLPKMTETNVSFNGDDVQCESVSFPELQTARDDFLSNPYNGLSSIDCPKLQVTGNKFLNKVPDKLTKIYFPGLKKTGTASFCDGITHCAEINLPALEEVAQHSFCIPKRQPMTTDTITLPAATHIGPDAFSNLSGLKHVNLPAAVYIWDRCFKECLDIATIDAPVAHEIHDWCFADCIKLIDVKVPKVVYLDKGVFFKASILESIDLPSCKYIRDDVLTFATKLKRISAPVAEEIGDNFLEYNEGLEEARFPAVKQLRSNWFLNAKKLRVFEAPNANDTRFRLFCHLGMKHIRWCTSLLKSCVTKNTDNKKNPHGYGDFFMV